MKARQARQSRQARSAGQRVAKLSFFTLGLLSTAFALVALGAPALFAYITNELPSVGNLELLLDNEDGALLHATQLYDRNGNLLLTHAPAGFEVRTFVDANDNREFALAFIAALDVGFLQENGSANTLATNLVREFLQADEEEGVLKNLRSRLLVAQAIQQFGRQQILEFALNSTSFGNLVFGAGDAARYYFGKSIRELDLAEAAYLAVMSKRPSLDPSEYPELAKKSQQELLLLLLDQGLISEDEARRALLTEIRLQEPPTPSPSLAPDFTNLALEQLISQFGEEQIARGGLEVYTTLDLNLQSEIKQLVGDQRAEIAILDPTSGQLLALLNHSEDAVHPPGTILSPFVYLTAFANGYSPASLIWDIPSKLLPDLPIYANADGKFHGPMNLRTALAQNYLVPALDLLSELGSARTWQVAQDAGLQSLKSVRGNSEFDVLMDGGELSTLEIAQAYGTLANQGLLVGQIQADFIQPSTQIDVRFPPVINLPESTETQTSSIIAPELAYLVTDILGDSSILPGNEKATVLAALDRPAALQMASSSDRKEHWAVGYSPQLVVAVWARGKDFSQGELGTLWTDLFEASHKGLAIQSWISPDNLRTIFVCVPSGMLPSADCPSTRREIFLPGLVPTQTDNLYQRLSVNRHSGKLATVFTPAVFIEEQIFIRVPVEAEEWAELVDFALPPADYDVVPNANQQDSSVVLLSPESFSTVRGRVRINGRSSSEESVTYRILVGEGLYPTQWIEITQETAIKNEDVATLWDTQDLEGPYAIQLQVISSDDSIQSAFSLVTVDNQAPQLEIIEPDSNQIVLVSESEKLLVSVNAEDNLSIKEVRFYMDGATIGTFNEKPYELAWPINLGDHTLRIVAIDQASNQAEEEINFEVLP